MTDRHIAAWVAAAVLFLSGCANIPSQSTPANPAQAWQQRLTELSGLESWEVKGKLAVKTHRRGGQASMLWHRQRQDHLINLYGPLGGGGVILTSTADEATLRDHKKMSYHAETAEELLYQVAGWKVPFGFMQYWLLGIPKPDELYEESIDDWGRLQVLKQSGWQIKILEYRDFSGRELPRKFLMTALPGTLHIADDESNENDQVQVKVIIKRWQFEELNSLN
jgi:outer membrane lipoprotein LolB